MMKNDFDISDLVVFEGMTSISSVIASIENGTSHRRICRVLYNADKASSRYNELKFLNTKASALSFELVGVPHGDIDRLAVGKTHGGFIAFCTKVEYPHLTCPSQLKDGGFYVYLDGIEDPYNFSYALRSIYASGADGIIVASDRFSTSHGLICKGSAGCSELMDMLICDMSEAVSIFKQKDYKIASAGIRNSVSLYDADLKYPLLLIVGGEKRGISSTVLQASDQIVRIDYGRSFMGSLTASSAATVLAFEVYRQNNKKI